MLSEYLATNRKKAHLTQAELATKLHVSTTTIQNWEKGTVPDIKYWKPLIFALRLQPKDFVRIVAQTCTDIVKPTPQQQIDDLLQDMFTYIESRMYGQNLSALDKELLTYASNIIFLLYGYYVIDDFGNISATSEIENNTWSTRDFLVKVLKIVNMIREEKGWQGYKKAYEEETKQYNALNGKGDKGKETRAMIDRWLYCLSSGKIKDNLDVLFICLSNIITYDETSDVICGSIVPDITTTEYEALIAEQNEDIANKNKEIEELQNKINNLEQEHKSLEAGLQMQMIEKYSYKDETNSSPNSSPKTSFLNKFNKNKSPIFDFGRNISAEFRNNDSSEINYAQNLLDDKLPSLVKDFLNKMSAQLGSARVTAIKDKTAEKITLYSLIIATIGETGLYNVKDITVHIKDSYGQSVTEVKVSEALNTLSKNRLVEEKEIKVGGAGRPSKKYVLTDVSKYYYALCNATNPVPSKMDIAINEQKSGSHGLTIVKIIGALTNAGYDCEQEVHRTASNGEDSIADIVAIKDGTQYFIEYEEGNYSKTQYEYKTKKILSLGDVIYIVKDMSVKEKLEPLVKNMARKYFMETAQMRKYVVETVANLQQNPDVIRTGK